MAALALPTGANTVMITGIEITTPRTVFDAAIVRVHTDA